MQSYTSENMHNEDIVTPRTRRIINQFNESPLLDRARYPFDLTVNDSPYIVSTLADFSRSMDDIFGMDRAPNLALGQEVSSRLHFDLRVDTRLGPCRQ